MLPMLPRQRPEFIDFIRWGWENYIPKHCHHHETLFLGDMQIQPGTCLDVVVISSQPHQLFKHHNGSRESTTEEF